MDERPPFDPIRACFYLVAGVLAFQGLIGFSGLLWCVYWSQHIIDKTLTCENISTTLNQLMSGALAAALAFTAAFTKKDK